MEVQRGCDDGVADLGDFVDGRHLLGNLRPKPPGAGVRDVAGFFHGKQCFAVAAVPIVMKSSSLVLLNQKEVESNTPDCTYPSVCKLSMDTTWG